MDMGTEKRNPSLDGGPDDQKPSEHAVGQK